jgi:DNA-binding LacI/PurR family transcriptional regulator
MANSKVYKKVCRYLKRAISNGEMQLGEAIYSENQLCELLNVSRTSVRRAIREMVEDNILESRQGIGTFVKGTTASKTICMVNHYTRVLRFSSIESYYHDLIFGSEEAVRDMNSRFQIFSGVICDESDITSKMSHLNADGIVIDGNFQDHMEDIDVFGKHYPNLVVLDGDPTGTSLPSVSPDLQPGFTELLKLHPAGKNENLLFLYNGSIARRRWAKYCFEQTIRRVGIANVDFCDYTANIPADLLSGINHGYLIAKKLEEIIPEKQYNAIYCGGDRTALHTLSFLKHQNYNVPGDIGVCSVGGIAFSAIAEPSITTLKIDSSQLAKAAVKQLHNQLQNLPVDKLTLVPVKLIRRQSL